MKITVIGAGNSGLTMAAHLILSGNEVTLWNPTHKNIEDLLINPIMQIKRVVEGDAYVYKVTSSHKEALMDPEIDFITTQTFSQKNLATQFAKILGKPITIILNPGRMFGALEFEYKFKSINATVQSIIAETQTFFYTCRKTTCNEVENHALKNDVLISTISGEGDHEVVESLIACLRDKFILAASMSEIFISNVEMIMHCASLLLNAGWVESEVHEFYYYREGISSTIATFIEKRTWKDKRLRLVFY